MFHLIAPACGALGVAVARFANWIIDVTSHGIFTSQAMRASLRSVPASIVMLAFTMMVASPLFARESTLSLIDSLRTRDCAHALSNAQRLEASHGLDSAAKEVMEGREIHDALRRADFHVTRSAVIHIRGDIGDASLERMLAKSYCGPITDPGLTAIGI